MNMELTTSELNLKNFIVKCKDTNIKGTNELFFIAGGKLMKSVKFPKDEMNGELENLKEFTENLYFNGNLFKSTLFNSYGKFEKDELDSMKIISNWIFHNNSPSTLLKIDDNTSIEKIFNFVQA